MAQLDERRSGRRQARARILDAATRLLHDGGATAVTTRAVAETAGVQAPAIYRLFGDKDGLLDAILEREFARFMEHKTAVADSDDPVADLRAAWRRHVRFGLENPGLFALLVDPARADSPIVAAGADVLRARVHRVAAEGRLRVGEPRAVELLRAAANGAVLTLLARADDERDPGLADALYDAVMRTALADAPPPGVDQLASAVVAVRAAAPELTVLSPGERALLAEWLDRIVDR